MAAEGSSWFKQAMTKVGLKKEEEVDWRDTNVGAIGSDADKDARKAAAETEPMWDGAGQEEGIQIWRVENKERHFGINHWPKEQYGSFCEGDSYIVMYTYKKDPESPKLSWNIHFWLGRETSQDEAGVAAYKTVELDDLLGTEPVQFREVQGWESQQFLSYFDDMGGMRILQGGVDSGFVHVEAVSYRARLLEIQRVKKYTRVSQVPLEGASLNEGEVFILDAGEKIYVFEGESSHPFERRKASEIVEGLKDERNGRAERCNPDSEFWEILGGRVTVAPASAAVERTEMIAKKLFKLDEANNWVQTGEGDELDPDMLTTDDIFLIDTGIEIFIRIGRKVPHGRKKTAILYGQEYLGAFDRPVHLPITCTIEGGESDYFWQAFAQPDGIVEPFVPEGGATHIAAAPTEGDEITASSLEVKIASATGLVAGDSNGFSDPFVRVKLSGVKKKGQEGKTAVVKKTLDPEWNETITLSGPFDSNQSLELEIWDKDYFSNDFLGKVIIPLTEVGNHNYPEDFRLGGKGPGDLTISGTLRLTSVAFIE